MSKVELVYDLDCPNITKARANLLKAFAAAGLEPRWAEWDRSATDCPSHIRAYGSPTILAEGRDVAGENSGNGDSCCRLYRNASGESEGAPSVEQIANALSNGESTPPIRPRNASGWRSSLAAVPGVVFALLPKVACPTCWPAYAGLLSSVGLGFLLDTAYLFPLTAAFLALAVGALAFRAHNRRGYGPFGMGLAAAAVVLVGKFAFGSNVAMYGGIGLLVAASVWNAWPVRATNAGCPACVQESSSTLSPMEVSS